MNGKHMSVRTKCASLMMVGVVTLWVFGQSAQAAVYTETFTGWTPPYSGGTPFTDYTEAAIKSALDNRPETPNTVFDILGTHWQAYDYTPFPPEYANYPI